MPSLHILLRLFPGIIHILVAIVNRVYFFGLFLYRLLLVYNVTDFLYILYWHIYKLLFILIVYQIIPLYFLDTSISLKWCFSFFLQNFVCRERVNTAGLRRLCLERPAYKAGLWLTSGNLEFGRVPTVP